MVTFSQLMVPLLEQTRAWRAEVGDGQVDGHPQPEDAQEQGGDRLPSQGGHDRTRSSRPRARSAQPTATLAAAMTPGLVAHRSRRALGAGADGGGDVVGGGHDGLGGRIVAIVEPAGDVRPGQAGQDARVVARPPR